MKIVLVIVVFLLVSLVAMMQIVGITNAQTTYFYERGYFGTTSNLNYCSFYITIYSPNGQATYVNTMPLKFNITWTEYPNFPIPGLFGYYAYSIDNGPFIEIISNQSVNDIFYQTSKDNFTINPSFSYTIDISNLEKGYHNLIINASLYHGYPLTHFYFNITTSPCTFIVGESNPESTPTITYTLSPSSTPSIVPNTNSTSSPTQQPLLEPNQTASLTHFIEIGHGSNDLISKIVTALVGIVAIIIAVVLSIIAHFKKAKKQRKVD